MFGISFEHLLILGVVLLILGPRRLPELGSALGKTLKSFKDALSTGEAEPQPVIRRSPEALPRQSDRAE